MATGRSKWQWAAIAVVFCALAFATWQFVEVASQGTDRVREFFESMGIWAPVLYVLSFALLEPFGAMGILFVGPGSLIWPWPELFLFSWLGAIGASIVGFSFARWLGRDQVLAKIPRRLLAYEARLERHPLLGVVLARMFLFLWPPAHWMLGLSRIRFGTFLLGSALGFALPMAAFTWLGKSIVDELFSQPPSVLVGAGVALVVLIALSRWLMSRRAGPPPKGDDDSVASPAPNQL